LEFTAITIALIYWLYTKLKGASIMLDIGIVHYALVSVKDAPVHEVAIWYTLLISWILTIYVLKGIPFPPVNVGFVQDISTLS